MQNQLHPLSPFLKIFHTRFKVNSLYQNINKNNKNITVWYQNVTKTLNDINNINSFKMGAMVSAHYQRKVTSRFNTEEVEYI